MRLIDADELIKYIKIWEIGTSISSDQKEFIDCINRQLTAFDADKIIEQLETRRIRAAALQKNIHQSISRAKLMRLNLQSKS